MPLYEYACSRCDYSSEDFVPVVNRNARVACFYCYDPKAVPSFALMRRVLTVPILRGQTVSKS